jgi:hypothetical protein
VRKFGLRAAFKAAMEGTVDRWSWGLAVAGTWLACWVGAPAAAQAGELDDACRQGGGSPSLCVGTEKLGERAAAECRRTGAASDEQCAGVPAGRRVIRRAIEEYERSWTHRALGLQFELGNDVGFANAPWIGTHNSFNSAEEFPTLSHTDSNQQLSLVDQLRLDMRTLELDVHWVPSAWAGGSRAPVVCHGRGGDELHAGCTTERLLAEVVAPVAAWLRAHPREVLLLYVEDKLDGAAGQEAAATVLQEQLGNLLYRPPQRAGGCSLLPLSLTRDDVLDAGAQVVVVSGCGSGPAWRATVFDWDGRPPEGGDPVHVETTAHGYGADCAPGDFSRHTYDTRLVRYYEDSTWLSATVNRYDAAREGVTAQAAGHMARCGVDKIDFDQILPDERLDAVVWSWARDEPRAAGGECAVQGADGRWRADSCTQRLPAACRRPGGGWTLAAPSRSLAAARQGCTRLGAALAVPRTGYENELLRVAREDVAGGVRLGYRLAGGRWAALDRR